MSAVPDPEDPAVARTQPLDIRHLAELFRPPIGVHSLGITLLAVLALFYTLYFMRGFLLPILLAVLLDFLLSPLVRTLHRFRIPTALGAFLVLAGLVGTLAYGLYRLSGPAAAWTVKLPRTIESIQAKMNNMSSPVQQVTQAAEQVEALTAGDDDKTKVELDRPSLSDTLLSSTQSVLFGTVMVVILLYFLLASGDLFLRKLIKVLPRLEDKVSAVQIASEIERSVSNYLFTMTLINVGLGAAVTVAMMALGMPNPVLWGILVGVTNFVPYLGPIVSSAIIGLVALATFDEVGRAVLAVALSFGLNSIEGNFVTPMILGRRLTLNPVVIFLGLTFWGWLWGIPGSLLAVPILATFKIFCDHIKPLAPIGEFLGE